MADLTLTLQRVAQAGIPHINFHTSALGEWEFGITRNSHGFFVFQSYLISLALGI